MLDTGSPTHICNSLQEMRVKRRLNKLEIQLRVGNGEILDVNTIRTVVLDLLNGCKLDLHDCYYVPSLIRQIISLPILDKEVYKINIKDETLCLYDKDNLLKCECSLSNCHYVLEIYRDVFNVEENTSRRSK